MEPLGISIDLTDTNVEDIVFAAIRVMSGNKDFKKSGYGLKNLSK
jgi:hypothetical protein